MKTNYIDIDDGKWGIVLVTDFDSEDEVELEAIMESFGLKRKKARHALKVLATPNSGMAISNDIFRMSVVLIGHATSKGQFINSIAHENAHVAAAIVDYYGEPCDGESMAYLSGYLMQKVMEEIGDFAF